MFATEKTMRWARTVLGLWNRLCSHVVFRVRGDGVSQLPSLTGALLVSNHVCFADPALVRRAMAGARGRGLANRLVVLPVRRDPGSGRGAAGGAGPGALSAEELAAARRDIEAGKLVCLFAEGKVPRSSRLLRFTRAMEEIVRGLDVPVIPVAIDLPWGSVVEVTKGTRLRLRVPRRLPCPAAVRFGEPLPSSVSAFRVRRAVQELQAALIHERMSPADTLPAKLIRTARRVPFRRAMEDHTGRKLSFIQVLAGALVLRRRLAGRLGGEERVGIFLPPSIPAALVNVALGLLGKVAVNLNYTASRESYDRALEKAQIRTVLTSRRFLEKIRREAGSEMLALEDIQGELTLRRRLQALLAATLLPSWLLTRLYAPPGDPNAPAAVLFSSGSTGDAKGVVLSHFNILSNIQGVHQLLEFHEDDRVIGVLPFFHSFGFTVTLWFPLLAGYGALFHPDPREGKAVARLAAERGGTVLVGPPTFFQIYLRQCPPESFAGLRYAIAGAEKLDRSLARRFEKRFGLQLLEGYGVTELSPAVSLNTFDQSLGADLEVGSKPGSIGHPLPGVAVKVVSVETGEELDAGEEGLLCVKGPNVMLGYLGEPERTAEVVVDGWYHTGDVGRIDEDGFLEITDRLSRFAKIGGEMVPHVKIEGELAELAPSARFAVTSLPCDEKGERLVVLHTPLGDGVTSFGLCQDLRAGGLPNLFVPRAENFLEIEEIPLLASGKLDLRAIREIARERLAPAERT